MCAEAARICGWPRVPEIGDYFQAREEETKKTTLPSLAEWTDYCPNGSKIRTLVPKQLIGPVLEIRVVKYPANKSKNQETGASPSTYLIPELVSNSLIVACAKESNREQLDQLIRGLDQAPDVVHLKVTIKGLVDGKEVTLASPTLTTLDNRQASIQIDGHTIELTPRVVRSANEPRMTHIPASLKTKK